jgi:hypothetical protein
MTSRHGQRMADPPAVTGTQATEFAWRVHAAQQSWASNADVKASILLGIEGGALYAIISADGTGGRLAQVGGLADQAATTIGVCSLLLAILAAIVAVFPRLRRRAGNSRPRQAIFFGDLRRWNPAELSSYLANLTRNEELDALSRQLIDVSAHNWHKHQWVRISLVMALAGIVVIAFTSVGV